MHHQKRISMFIVSFIMTVAVSRIFLFFLPYVHVSIGKYHVHHLFMGIVLVIVSLVFILLEHINKYVIMISGIGTGLVLDEFVFLIVAEARDLSYSSGFSFLGALVSTSIVLLITVLIYHKVKNGVS